MSEMEATFLSGKQAWQDSGAALSPWCFCRLKRSMDLFVAVILVLVALPVMVIIALLVKATSPGPVLFRQKRLGKEGAVFELLKFRNEEQLLAQIAPEELESFYVKKLLPHKIALELEYARKASIVGDTVMLLRTAAAVLQ